MSISTVFIFFFESNTSHSFNVPVPGNGPAPYDAFKTAKACEAEIIYPEAMEISGE